jgi:hypothetical protein
MVGKYRSKKWLKSSLPLLSKQWSVSDHITYFYTEALPKDQWIPLTIMEFQNIVTELELLGNPCKCGVVIPLLGKWKKIRFKVPSTSEEIEAEFDMEPPSLFLENWEFKNYEWIEEYRLPINSGILLNPEKTIKPLDYFYTYYREYRSFEDLLNNWEYGRCIYIEYFPNGRYAFL